MSTLLKRISRYADQMVGVAVFFATFTLYLRTLAPSVAYIFDDSLEFQLLAPRLAIAHPTGYPLYSILIKLFTYIPLGDVAYRVNLASAFFAALAVAIMYAAARQLVTSRAAALVAALIFALGETFWSQAVLAEVYALQALLTATMLWLALDASRSTLHAPLITLAFFFGLMLTHHRLSILLAPALVVYVLAYQRNIWREPRTLLKMAGAFVLPLLLYLYLPLRGLATSSLDGTYQNTPAGFISWVLGASYSVFLTENPLNQNRDAAYYLTLFLQQFTPVGLLLAAVGFGALYQRARREWLFLALALAANLIFALTYRVADVAVFFIPTFLFTTLFSACGIDALVNLSAASLYSLQFHRCLRAPAALPLRSLAPLLPLLFIFIPYTLLQTNLPRIDLSTKWDVHDYGRDMLAQPLPANATLVGILGEMSLARYFQETQNLRADVQTIAADKEPARLAAVERALKENRTVFLTRQLAGLEKRYALTSVGPLILVQPQPNQTVPPAPAHALNQDFGGAKLSGYDLDLTRLSNVPDRWHLENGSRVRVTLYWRVEKKIPEERFVSLKLLGADGTRAGQLDRRPVLDAYPTTAWRNGEYLADTYDIPIFIGAAPGEYTLQVTMYNPEAGDVRGQAELGKITLAPDTRTHPAEVVDVEHLVLRDFGGLTFVGYSFDNAEPFAPGAKIPLTTLWRSADVNAHAFSLALLDGNQQPVHQQNFSVGYSASVGGQYQRQELEFALPANLTSGTFALKLLPPNSFLQLPFISPPVDLGLVRLKPIP